MLNPSTTGDQLDSAFAAARARAIDVIIVVRRRGPDGYDAAFGGLGREVSTGVVQLGTPGFIVDAKTFALAAQKHGLPNIAFLKVYVSEGVLMSYGPRQETYFPRSVTLADRILKGEKPAELPIEQPAEFELAINLATAKVIGLNLPPSLLARADEVIE